MSSPSHPAAFPMPTVIEAVERIRGGRLSPVELVSRCVESIKSTNSNLNAFGDLYPEAALAQAEVLDREARAGNFRGPLHGVPFGIKDLFYTQGLRTTRGSLTALDHVPSQDAPIIQRLKAAGAILLGKTATTEFGWTGSSVSRVFGAGRTPWNPELTSGGSSSGSAIAVAARMVPAALGSDGGGSVRIPSAFCGTFALKGTLGRIPAWPWSATEMLSHAGPITRTVRDSALLFDILSGPDARDHLSLPAPDAFYLDACEQPLPPLRVAFCQTLFEVPVDPQVSHAVAVAAELAERRLHCLVEPLSLDWQDPIKAFETLWVAGRGIAYGEALKSRLDELDPGFARLIGKAGQYRLGDYLDAMKARAAFAGQVHELFEQYDLLITPTLPILPFAAEATGPQDWPDHPDSAVPWASWTPFTYPFNLSGNPAASLPCGWSREGLPIGLQVIGPRFAEARVLQFCAAMEAVNPWEDRLPPV